MTFEPPARDRLGQTIEAGDHVLVMDGMTSVWGPFARVISTYDEAGIGERAIVIRPDNRISDLPDLSTMDQYDPIIAARDVEITPSSLVARYARRKVCT